MSSPGTTLLANTASNGIFVVLERGLRLATFAILFRLLPAESFGALLVLQALVAAFSVLDFGLSTAIERGLGGLAGERRGAAVALLAWTHLGMGLAGALVLAGLEASGALAGLGVVLDGAAALAAIAALCVLFWSCHALRPVLRGLNRVPDVNRTALCATVLGSIGLVAVAATGETRLPVLLATAWLPEIVAFALQLRLVRDEIPAVRSLRTWGRGAEMLELFDFGRWVFVMRASSQVANGLDRVLVGAFLGAAAVPVYYGLLRVVRLPTDFNQVLRSAVVPVAAELRRSRELSGFWRAALAAVGQTSALFAFVTLLVVLFAAELLLLVGGESLESHRLLVQVCCLLAMPVEARSFLSNMLVGAGDAIRRQALWAVCAAGTYLALLAGGASQFGTEGAVAARAANQLVMFAPWLLLVLPAAGLPVGRFLATVGRSVTVLGLLATIVVIAEAGLRPDRGTALAMKVGVAALAGAVLWRWLLDDRLRDPVRARLFRWRRA
jgi:O-antigen/teichoic acid export membrane protein